MILQALQDPFARRMGWALIHFLWQGALVALLLKLGLWALRKNSPNSRYLLGCVAMVCLVSAPILTLLSLPDEPPRFERRAQSISPGTLVPLLDAGNERDLPDILVRVFVGDGASGPAFYRWVEANLPTLLLAWMGGVLLFSARLGAGWWHVRRLTNTGKPLATSMWTELLTSASGRLGVTCPVKLLESAVVEVPTVLGWMRPVVLLPASTLTGLSPNQLETILAHELAHIRRHDYLVNLLQNIAETTLFYHPAVWWVSAQIRNEREDCCDDAVVTAYGDPAGYAGALATLETLRGAGPLVVAASGGRLLARIQRLLGQPPASTASGVWVMGAAISLALGIWCAGESNVLAKSPLQLDSLTDGQPSRAEAAEPAGRAPQFQVVDPVTGRPVAIDPALSHQFTRTYKVNPNTFTDSIRRAMGNADGSLPAFPNTISTIRAFFGAAGVDFSTNTIFIGGASLPPAHGKALFYNDRTGLLLVRAAMEELDIIEKALQVIQPVPPQVVVEIKFVELGEDDFKAFGLETVLPNNDPTTSVLVTNQTGTLRPPTNRTNEINLFAPDALAGIKKVTAGTRGILTDAQFRTVLRAIEQRPGADVLTAPRITTLSGRQARIEVADMRNIVTGVTLGESNQFTTSAIPVGTSIDVIPYVSPDGQHIDMNLIFGITAFVGYDDPGAFFPSTGGVIVQKPLPRFRVSQTVTRVTVPDGQTLVLSGFDSAEASPDEAALGPKKQIVLFVTPTVIDPAGNRVNPD